MPDVASVPENVHATGWFHQPVWSGARAAAGVPMVGGVWSTRIVAVFDTCVEAKSQTTQVTFIPVVSVLTVFVSQLLPGIGTKFGSTSVHLSVTALVCQSEQFAATRGSGGSQP